MKIFPFLERSVQHAGEEAVLRFQNTCVLVAGVGGVGSYAAEILVRSGIGSMILVDGDTVEMSNINRQLPALMSTLGQYKTGVMAERFRDINPELKLQTVSRFLQAGEWGGLLQDTRPDFVVDAIDSVGSKADLLSECLKRQIPVVSSMGSGGRMDPGLVQVADIGKTHHDRLAKAVRGQLAKLGIRSGIRAVFSPEEVDPACVREDFDENTRKRSSIGTLACIPAVFGCFCASVVLREIAGEKE